VNHVREKNVFLDKVLPTTKHITETAIDWLSVLLLSGIFVLGIAQVFWRWILRDPITWSEELIQLTYVWVCYLGWTIAERKDSHIRITAVMNFLPKNVQKWLQIFCHILCIIFSILMVYYGIKLVGVGAKRTAVSFAMNYAIVYLMGPICNFIIIIYEIAGLIECFVQGPRDYRDKGGDEE
jgi:TRAP-type C4-dicarboxylate transport system permease small subunit